ncbi:MAG: YdcF family protein [Cytophagales bacterium]|nr:YdcF family protein [Cytophagales bacterium]
MTKEVLIVLGSPNSQRGKLSIISRGRLECCVKLYSKGKLILCTGGWGEHFNTSKEAHAVYAKRFLIEMGINEEDFLDFALSENTVDDAVKIKPIISNLGKVVLTIITSDYHLERVTLIFNEILKDVQKKYVGAKSTFDKFKLEQLISHEKKAIDLIKRNGLYYEDL